MYQPISFTLRHPLLDLRTCAGITNKRNRDLVLAIEDGSIQYAFDLRTANSGKREIRVLALSLRQFVDGVRPQAAQDTPARTRQVVSELFPAFGESIESRNFARIVSCCSYHITRLIKGGHLSGVRPTQRSGPNSSAKIPRVVAIDFLCSRRVLP